MNSKQKLGKTIAKEVLKLFGVKSHLANDLIDAAAEIGGDIKDGRDGNTSGETIYTPASSTTGTGHLNPDEAVAGGVGFSSRSDVPLYVSITSCGEQKVKVMAAVREITGMGLAEAKMMVESAPSLIIATFDKTKVENARQKLWAAGAKVEEDIITQPKTSWFKRCTVRDDVKNK